MRTPIDYLREIHRIAHDQTLGVGARLGRIQAEAFRAVTEADAIALDCAAWDAADQRSYGTEASLRYVLAFKAAYNGEDFEPASTPEVDGCADGRAHRAAHGGSEPEVVSSMATTIAADSVEMRAERTPVSAAVAS